MAVAVAPPDTAHRVLVGDAPPSPAGPLEAPEPIRLPPARKQARFLQTIRFGMRPMGFSLAARAQRRDRRRDLTGGGVAEVVGQVMKHSQGRANPGLAQNLIKKQLGV